MLMRTGLPVLSSQTDKPREYCGVMAVYDPQKGLAARFVHRVCGAATSRTGSSRSGHRD